MKRFRFGKGDDVKIQEIKDGLGLTVETASGALDREVTAAYVSDLLSDVMGNAPEKCLWITLQVHENIVAVASLKQIQAILLVNDRRPAEPTARKAEAEGIPILVSSLPAFELAGRLYEMGLRSEPA